MSDHGDNCKVCGKRPATSDGDAHCNGYFDCPLCHGHAEPQPTADATGVDLTVLIERLLSNPVGDDGFLFDEDTLRGTERDAIVLALRVLRVLRETANASRADGVHLSERDESIRVDVEHEDHYSYGVTLDDAERLLGIGGDE